MKITKKLRAIAIDDDKLATLMLEKIVSKTDNVELISCHNNPVTGLSSVIMDRPDLLFLDMDMPYLSGIEILKILDVLEHAPKIVVISGKDHLEKKAKEMNVAAFCPKPLDEDHLIKSLLEIWGE